MSDEKQPTENTELIKDGHDSKRNYIFQKNKITKTGFIIIVVLLIIIVAGIIYSGIIFGDPDISPPPREIIP